ncbi:MAG: hypothetical protein R3D57_09280 [Hyphomicrobiaceae bacterium]
MLSKAARSIGQTLMLGEADIYARFAVLFAIGVAGIVVFYWSLIATIQILAQEAGSGLDDGSSAAAFGLGVLLWAGLAPILRFLVTDLPELARQVIKEKSHYLLMGLALAVSSLVLLLA